MERISRGSPKAGTGGEEAGARFPRVFGTFFGPSKASETLLVATTWVRLEILAETHPWIDPGVDFRPPDPQTSNTLKITRLRFFSITQRLEAVSCL